MNKNDKPRYTLGIDQYGTKWRIKGDHPRKELIEKIGNTHCSIMYCDGADGKNYRIGYVIGPHWVTLYTQMRIPV